MTPIEVNAWALQVIEQAQMGKQSEDSIAT